MNELVQALLIAVITIVVTLSICIVVDWVREKRRRRDGLYTRRFSWCRAMLPSSVIGFLLGYGDCNCGTSWWRDKGVAVENKHGGGSMVCTGCYRVHQEQIDRHNEVAWECQKRLFYNSGDTD